jgi:hypothetical protein
MKIFRHWTAWIVLSVFLSGCRSGDDAENALRAYQEVVIQQTGLAADWSPEKETSLRSYPRIRDRLVSVRELRIGMFDFLRLGECELQYLIGHRNSSLGRVMPPSQQLIYEYRFVHEAKRCIAVSDGASSVPSSMKWLQEALPSKQQELPKVFWNATFGSADFERFFSLSSGPFSTAEGDLRGGDVAEALRYLIHVGDSLGSTELEIDGTRLEEHFQVLRSSRFGGRLLQSLQMMTVYLEAVSSSIEAKLSVGLSCDDPEAQALYNVFQDAYVGRLQSYIARLHRDGRDTVQLWNRLAAPYSHIMPETYEPYFSFQLSDENPDGVWLQFERAIDRHNRSWQKLLDACGYEVVSGQ